MQILREKRKKTDRFIREEADKEERKIQKMLQECEYLEQDMDEIQREYEERKQEWELLEKTIKNQEKEKESDLNKRSDEGTKESRSKYFIAAGLGGHFYRQRHGLLMEQIYGGTVGSAFRTVCMDRRFCFCDRRVRSCGRRL